MYFVVKICTLNDYFGNKIVGNQNDDLNNKSLEVNFIN